MDTQNFTIVSNIDWLSLTYILLSDEKETIENFKMGSFCDYRAVKETETAQWKGRVIIYNSFGVKKLTFLFSPKSSLFSKFYCLVEFANNVLYTNEWKYLLANLHYFVNGYLVGISRIDFCCDTQYYFDENFEKQDIRKAVLSLYNNSYYVVGKREGMTFFDIVDDDDKKISLPRQISFGSKTSKIKWKFYNKTQEILAVRREKGTDSKYKDYIFQLWKMVGFDTTKDTWRIECSIKNANTQLLNDDNGNNLLSTIEIVKERAIFRIFNELTANYFKVKCNDGNKNKNRNRDVVFFNSKSSGFKIERKIGEPRPETDEIKSTIRFLFKKLQQSTILYYNDNRQRYINYISELLDTNDLNLWFSDTFGPSFNEWILSVNQLNNSKNDVKNFEKSFEKITLFNN